MYSRPIRTSLELLRPPRRPVPQPVSDSPALRTFNKEDKVFAKVYASNKWTWVPGVIMEKLSRVMYNVWVNNSKMIRSHINQLKKPASSAPVNDEPVLVPEPADNGASSSSSSTSSDFQSAAETSPVVPLPRRSSRPRRPPQWYQGHHRY
ncbi:uncharacterized protein LOC129716991 [Wyeomyia smithii]|uniref:uncharacterized protein LOC129716991 n=1 Tax=Wyeomyia smithii TaxID=174621 RepID=UPI002467D91F|nr:uncharacterized protein LOC129716991 [Wyeomyia smithii]